MSADTKKAPELLSPAGNPEKLRYAVDYGADAVYCALDRFGMRAGAGNFTPPELAQGVEYAHARGKRVYVTVNTMPHEGTLGELAEYARILGGIRPDAYIVSDPGVIDILRENTKDPVIHLSTQASTVNSAAVKFWYRQGVKRIVLARELTLAEIAEIRRNIPPDAELECFVHGAMCVSYSGRCLLSNYFTARDANGGGCAQPCRWKYYLREEKRGEAAVAEEYGDGTYIFSSRDMNMIRHLKQLAEAGIDSFKIEGRMKSAYYTAAVTNAYRIALDDMLAGRGFDERCLRETESVSHREYGTGYYFAKPAEEPNTVSVNEYISDRPFLCTVESYDPAARLAKCRQRNKMCVGEKANLLSPGGFGSDFVITALYDTEMNPISATPHAGMEFYIPLENARAGDIIRGA